MTFPAARGEYHVHIWGKNQSMENQKSQPSVDAQYQELSAYYQEVYKLQLTQLQQVHGDQLVTFGSVCEMNREGDACLSEHPDIALLVKTADCIPILFFNPERILFGAIHSGWRGLKLNLLQSTIAQLPSSSLVVNVEALHFVIGPHINQSHYETGEDVYAQFPLEFSYPVTDSQKRNLDMQAILKTQLIECNIPLQNQTWINHDTFNSNHYFSHRSGDTARNFNIIFFKKTG